MGIEYMAQIWKQFQPEIWQRLTPVYVSFAAEISFWGKAFVYCLGKNVSFLIILSFGKINKKMIWAPDLGLEFGSLHAAGLNHSFK